MRVIEGVVVHCSATRPDFMAGANTVARFAEIRRWHVENEGWSDIGYHFGIDRPGGVTSLRPLERTGAHVKFHNARTIGVVLLGGHGAAETDRFQDHFTAAVIAFRADAVAIGAANGWLWRAADGNSRVHRLAYQSGSVIHMVGSGGDWVTTQVDNVGDRWTYAIAAWNNTTRLARLAVRDGAPAAATGTAQDLSSPLHYVGGDNNNGNGAFTGQIGAFGLWDADLFDDAARLDAVHRFFEAWIGRVQS